MAKSSCYLCKKEFGRLSFKMSINDLNFGKKTIPSGMTNQHKLCNDCFTNIKKKPKKVTVKENNKIKTIQFKDTFLIPESEISDKEKQDFMTALEINHKKYPDKKENIGIPYIDENTGKIEVKDVNLCLPIKCSNEKILWYRLDHDVGIINSKIKSFEVLTNYRAYYFQLPDPTEINMVSIRVDLDVVVNNQKRYSDSDRMGGFGGVRGRGMFSGISGGMSSSESKTVGNVSLLSDGEIMYTFHSVHDPHGLAKLARHAVKHYSKLHKKVETEAESIIVCEKCESESHIDSKFCNNCGRKFTNVCANCDTWNLSSAKFCNECGKEL